MKITSIFRLFVKRSSLNDVNTLETHRSTYIYPRGAFCFDLTYWKYKLIEWFGDINFAQLNVGRGRLYFLDHVHPLLAKSLSLILTSVLVLGFLANCF